jgi:hypothetical protein
MTASADTITILGRDDATGDSITLYDNTEKGIAGIGLAFAAAGVPHIVVADSVRAEGDTLIVSTRQGNDTIDASAIATDRAALKIIAGDGNDILRGSRFNDVLDGGMGSDSFTGDLGYDVFLDSSPSASNGVDDNGDGRIDEPAENEKDTLIEYLGARTETRGADVGLYNDKLVIGSLLNAAGNAPFEVGTNAANELIDAGDRYAADATLENLNNLFEIAIITGGAGNNTMVVNDLDRSIRVGGTTLSVINWRGRAILDNAANDSAYAEHYLVTIPAGSTAVVDIRSTGTDGSDRLVVTGSDAADRFMLRTASVTTSSYDTALKTVSAYTGTFDHILAREIPAGKTALFDAMVVNYQGVENVDINSRGGDDRFAVNTINNRTTIYAAAGNDAIYVGSNALLGGLGQSDTNTNGNLNAINALLTVNGQGAGDSDLLMLDDTGDTLSNHGTLTGTRVTNGVVGSPGGLRLMGAGGSITYGTLESLRIHLGDAANGNVFTVESTHGNGSSTTITSGIGPDVFNIETLVGDLGLSTGGGNDMVRVGSTAGDVGQTNGAIDAYDASLNGLAGRLEVDGGTGSADTLKLFDGGDIQRENGRLSSSEIVGLGMTLGVGYTGFDVFKAWLSNGDNNLYIASTHTGTTYINLGDEPAILNGTNDVVNINSTGGPTTIDAGQGNDVIRVNFDVQGSQTFRSGINGELTLHGQAGSDRYEIGLAGQLSSRINAFDQSNGDPGINRLRIYGTNEADFFLLRANKDIGLGMVAAIEVDANRLPVAGGVIERINYDADISGAVEIYGRNGDDTFVLDDNLAPTTIFGDAGNDTFQAGQVYQSFRDARNPDNGLAEEDYFQTTQITRGFLSNGVSAEHRAVRRYRQRQLHGLQQQGRALPLRRRGRRHLHGAGLRQGRSERSEGALHQHQRRAGRGLHRLHGQCPGAHRRRRRLRYPDGDRHRVRRRLRGQRPGRLWRRPVRQLYRPRKDRRRCAGGQ